MSIFKIEVSFKNQKCTEFKDLKFKSALALLYRVRYYFPYHVREVLLWKDNCISVFQMKNS